MRPWAAKKQTWLACNVKLIGDCDTEVWARAEDSLNQDTSEESKNSSWEEIFKEFFQMSFEVACLSAFCASKIFSQVTKMCRWNSEYTHRES